MRRQKTPVKQMACVLAVAMALSGFVCVMADDSGKSESWDAPPHAAAKKNPVPADATSIAAGKAIYQDQCVCCHGPKGKGDGPQADNLPDPPCDLTATQVLSQTDGALFWKISTGRHPMPRFEKLIPKATDRWSTVNFLRTLGPPPTTQTADAGHS